jgi:hypothetical protein
LALAWLGLALAWLGFGSKPRKPRSLCLNATALVVSLRVPTTSTAPGRAPRLAAHHAWPRTTPGRAPRLAA